MTLSLLLEIDSSFDLSGISTWSLMTPNYPFIHWRALFEHTHAYRIHSWIRRFLREFPESKHSLTFFLLLGSVQITSGDTCALRLTEFYVSSQKYNTHPQYWQYTKSWHRRMAKMLLLFTKKINSPLFPVPSTLGPTLLRGVQIKSK